MLLRCSRLLVGPQGGAALLRRAPLVSTPRLLASQRGLCAKAAGGSAEPPKTEGDAAAAAASPAPSDEQAVVNLARWVVRRHVRLDDVLHELEEREEAAHLDG